jgi:hypothetical protein
VRALDKKKPFLIRCENQRTGFRQNLQKRFKKPGPYGFNKTVGCSKANDDNKKGFDKAGAELSQMFSESLGLKRMFFPALRTDIFNSFFTHLTLL